MKKTGHLDAERGTVTGVIALRRSRQDLARPCRMWGYPYTTLAFILAGSAFMLNTLFQRPPSLIGSAVMAAGIPVYFLWRRTR